MEKNAFNDMILAPFSCSEALLSELHEKCDQFPYCALLQQMLLYCARTLGSSNNLAAIEAKASLYVTDTNKRPYATEPAAPAVPTRVETPAETPVPEPVAETTSETTSETTPETEPTPETKEEVREAVATEMPAESKPETLKDIKIEQPEEKEEEKGAEKYDVIKEINAYQEVSFKTAPKSVILSNFLESSGNQTEENAEKEPESVVELGKKSIASHDFVETETMAVIYAKQGKYEKALNIYLKLLSKNPEKNSTFAPRIQELKILLENK